MTDILESEFIKAGFEFEEYRSIGSSKKRIVADMTEEELVARIANGRIGKYIENTIVRFDSERRIKGGYIINGGDQAIAKVGGFIDLFTGREYKQHAGKSSSDQ